MALGADAPGLHLDHVSIGVPDLQAAIKWLGDRLGLRATVSPSDPARHSRVYLDRSYLEVSAREPVDAWMMGQFFLRFADPAALRKHLDRAGLEYTFGEYEGVDGLWDDVELRAAGVPLPILVRRTEPRAEATDWPPPLTEPQPCGAHVLDAVIVSVPDIRKAVAAYARLLGLPGVLPVQGGVASAALASGRILLCEGERAGLAGLVLGVDSLAAAARAAGPLTGSPVGWVELQRTHGLRIGFRERANTTLAAINLPT